jgi:hypothetical protein
VLSLDERVESSFNEEAAVNAKDPTEDDRVFESISADRASEVTTTLALLQKKIRLKSKPRASRHDSFDFGLLKNELPHPVSSPSSRIGDGFDKHELHWQQKCKGRDRVLEKALPLSAKRLVLVTSEQMYSAQSHDRAFPETRTDALKTNDMFQDLTTTIGDYNMHRPMHKAERPIGLRRTKKRTPSIDMVTAQLLSLTAPLREWSDSDESDSSSHLDNKSEIDDLVLDTMPTDFHSLQSCHIDADDMLLDAIDEVPSSGSVQVLLGHHVAMHNNELTYPGQLARMKSSGRWNETGEDIEDLHMTPQLKPCIA